MRRKTIISQIYKTHLTRLFLACCVIFLTGCSCNRLFFFPEEKLLTTPAKANIEFRDVFLQSQDGTRLHAWHLLPQADVSTKGRILYLHGNAQNISTHIQSVYWLPEFGFEVLLLDYRGFGRSEGTPCLPGVIEDVESAYQYLHELEPRAPLYILGQSIGGSLAAYALGSNPNWSVDGLILDAPFSSYRDIARDKFSMSWLLWSFQYPLSHLFSDEFSPDKVIRNIENTPLLLFYSTNDLVVPARESIKLYENATGLKRAIDTKSKHNQALLQREHKQQLLDFLNEILESRAIAN